jgi:cold shock CspA family protein
VTKRPGKLAQPSPPTGRPMTGRIVRILRGQGHGFIRAKDGREVFFHRGDVPAGTFNDLAVDAHVEFDVIEDHLTGPRATNVRQKLSR